MSGRLASSLVQNSLSTLPRFDRREKNSQNLGGLPRSGPAEDRPGAPCHEDANLIHESVYSGYAKCHGLKILTVTLPNGLIGALFGAISTRENDNRTLNLSNLNVDLMMLQPDVTHARKNGEDMLYYSIYSDAIFPLLNCITGHHRQPLLEGDLTE